jgi:predicted glycosyltransferase
MAMPAPTLKPEIEQVPDLRLASFTLKGPRKRKKIWIDLDNSPHVPFFAPIIDELEKSGCSVLVTARDCFQVRELADLLHLNYRLVGRHYGKNKILKLTGLCWRALQLVPEMLRFRPQLALSHGSRSQLVVANLLRIPSVTVADYEFSKIWMGVRPTWVITPEIIPSDRVRCSEERILKYPGIKEEVYVPRFKPDSSILASLGLEQRDGLVVVIRPPATEAHYHRPETDVLFTEVLTFLGSKPKVKMVLLPRNEDQASVIRSKWGDLFASGRILIPSRVTDGLNLIWHSDLVISGGGTMNREAAALGVPVYSIFRGEIGAVDRHLASTGRLTLIERPQDVAEKLALIKRKRTETADRQLSGALNAIVGHVETILSRAN